MEARVLYGFQEALSAPPAADTLVKLAREAEGFGLALARDRVGAPLQQRAAAARAWLDRCKAVRRDALALLKVFALSLQQGAPRCMP